MDGVQGWMMGGWVQETKKRMDGAGLWIGPVIRAVAEA